MIALQNVPQTGLDFSELVREHQSMVFSVCWHYLHDRDQAEDVAQEVFLGLHRNMASIQSASHAIDWCSRTKSAKSSAVSGKFCNSINVRPSRKPTCS